MQTDQNHLSLYLHFPFCRKKCGYCNFPSTDQELNRIDAYIEALIRELTIRTRTIAAQSIQTLYIGGGSPNLMGIDNFQRLGEALQKNYNLNSLKEFTIEINPGIDETLIALFEQLKVTRLSVGCQSFQLSELHTLDRIHNIQNIEDTLNYLQVHRLPHLNLDFIYGIPGQSLKSWQATLCKAIQTAADHLSLYNLIFEPGTLLNHQKISGQIKPLTDNLEWRMYSFAHHYLQTQGFEHYEISNWAKPGCKALHNSNYWSGGKYLGLGAGAHSFDGETRSWNRQNIDNYISCLQKQCLPPLESEKINANAKIYEYLLLGLRTSLGLDLNEFNQRFNLNFPKIYQEFCRDFGMPFENKYGSLIENRLRLTPQGWFISDYIIQKLIKKIDEERGRNGD